MMNILPAQKKILGCLRKSTEENVGELLPAGYTAAFIDDWFSLFFCSEGVGGRIATSCWPGGIMLVQGAVLSIDGSSAKDLSIDELVEQYSKIGDKFFDSLDGSYSIVLWDSERQRLFLSRDDYGTKLLYYFQCKNGYVWFSNNLDELLKIVGRQPVSNKGLFEFLRFLDISPPYTIFEDVFFLEPEKILIGERGKDIQLREKVCEDNSSFEPKGWGQALDAFEGRLKDSISARLGQAGKVGVFLSGGIDSSLVCAIASTVRDDIEGITVGFRDAIYDESAIARRVADHLGIRHHVMSFSQEEDFNAFYKFVSSAPSPFADPAIIPTFQCFERIGSQFDVVLDGTGADTLSGIMPARHIHFILNFSRHLPPLLRTCLSKGLKITPLIGRYYDLFNFQDPAELLIRWEGWSKHEIKTLCGQACDLSHTMFYQIYLNNPRKSPYELYSMLMGALPDDRIHQSAVIWGPEVGFPFFDREVRKYVHGLPFQFRYGDKESKRLFRVLLEKYVPRAIWDVPKHGFDYPFEKLLLYRDAELIREYISASSLAEHNLFDSSMVNNYTQRFLSGDHTLKFKIWALVVFQAWYGNYYKRLGHGVIKA